MISAKSYGNSGVREVQFGDPALLSELDAAGGAALIAGEAREFYVHSVEDEVIYLECPLCGGGGSIYGGNRFYTQACCYLTSEREHGNVSLEVERWTAEHLLAGESIDEVHTTLTGLRSRRTPPRRDYVERIHAILHDARSAGAYKHYLETSDEGSWGDAVQGREYLANEESIITAEEDTEHERAADAVELFAAESGERL